MTFLATDDGVRLRYIDRGEGPSTFVLVHGWKGSHRLWDHVVVRLSGAHRVVAFDLRGMGESDKPRCRYDFDQLSDDLGFVLSELDLEDVTLVGWSMGCTVSLRYLERGGGRVGRLVLSNGPLRLTRTDDFPHTITREEFEGHLAALEDGWPASEREFQAGGLADPDPATIAWLYAIALQTPLPIVLETARAQAELDMRAALAQLDVPVLALYARDDPYYPPELADYIATHAKHGAKVLLDRGAHYVQVQAPDAFAAALEQFAAAGRAPASTGAAR
jgi:pimeloyl-ACP methyl ester carboxylesterase